MKHDKLTNGSAILAVVLSVLAAFAMVAAGCTTFEARSPTGERYRYSNGVFDKKIGKLTFESKPDGTKKATLEGVQSGLNADALKAIAEGAAAGAAGAAK